MWQPISTAPFASDLELAVIDGDGPHALVFPCRRILNGWMNSETKERLDVRPTHWRDWAAVATSA
jgi:hypothetical protein